jgi:hypothetical protein
MTIPTTYAIAHALWVPRDSSERPLVMAVTSFLGACLVFYAVILLHIQVSFLWANIVFPASVIFMTYCWWTTRDPEERLILRELGLRCAGFYVVMWSISMATDFQGHHFLSVIPFLLALFLPAIDALALHAGEVRGRQIILWSNVLLS